MLIMSLGLALSINSLKAQVGFKGTKTNPTVVTTVSGFTTSESPFVNSTPDTLNLTLSGDYIFKLGIQARVLKTSGTIAGKLKLWGSNYGTTGTWDAIDSLSTLVDQSVNAKRFEVTQPTYKYLMFTLSGGTTMAGTVSANAVAIKPN